MKVRWTSSAAANLKSIADYLHAEAPLVAAGVVGRLYAGYEVSGRFHTVDGLSAGIKCGS